MNDTFKERKAEKRHGRRPEWISVRVISKASIPIDLPPPIMKESKSEKAQHDINNNTSKPVKLNTPTSRIASWLGQQFNEREKQIPNASWIDDREASTVSKLSLASSELNERASSVPRSPTSPIYSRFWFKPRAPTVSPRPSSSNTDRPSSSSPSSDLTNHEDDDNYNTYETASRSSSYLESMDGRLDEINDNSSDSIYFVDDNSNVLETMDPKLVKVFLEWQKRSLLQLDLSCESLTSSALLQRNRRDFIGLRLDNALRSYCENVNYEKANVNTIDQVLKLFALLYWSCNPTKLLQCAELVYVVSYSLMSLNTDLYAGQKHTTMNDFCGKTINLIQDHHFLLIDDGQQTLIDYLEFLYKSVKRSSLVPLYQSPESCNAANKEPSQRHYHHQQQEQHRDKPKSSIQSETAFTSTTLAKSTSTPSQRRSNSLRSTKSASWTLLRRKDTYLIKIGPYKEGPLSCQLNEEEWKICWVILQQGYLHIYYHQQDNRTAANANHKNIGKKVKKRFMQHLTPFTATDGVPRSSIAIGGINNGQLLEKQTPYQQVDIHLAHTLCQLVRPHVFTLQLAHNTNTYLFDCGSESQASIWIQGCNFWAARETKVVPSPSNSLSPWKRPGHPAGASVLDKDGQQEAIDTHLTHLQTELQCLVQQQQRSERENGTCDDKRMYLEFEIRKYQCYYYSIHQ